MNKTAAFDPRATLAAEENDRLQEICEAFEDAWQQGKTAPAEEFLAGVADSIRPHVLYHLLRTEFEYRRKDGPAPRLAHALKRFPQDEAIVRAAFGRPAESPLFRIGPYQIYELVGEGGMGRVLRGWDPKMDRELAFKVMHEKYRDAPTMVQRFAEEACITSQLQHPGIPPVHEMGRTDDDLPYFSMKLIRGVSLLNLLKERADRDVPQLLQIFEQICQTIAYAHSEGVIHRDLKPGNIMVGMFGEVQVMDWGLARRIGLSPAPFAPPRRGFGTPDELDELFDTRDATSPHEDSVEEYDSSRLTRQGELLGTLPYMPPEQARGDLEQVDERADVFALGAILCEILTGQPPYTGSTAEEMRRQVEQGDTGAAIARLSASGADPDLVELTGACLSADPASRPPTARAVADAVDAHQKTIQERLKTTEIARAAAEATAVSERRSRRRTMFAAAAILLVFMVGGAVGLWAFQERQSRFARFETTFEQLMRDIGEEKWRDARGGLDRAEGMLSHGGTDGMHRRVAQARLDLGMVERFEEILLEKSNVVDDAFDNYGACARYAKAFGDYGIDVRNVHPDEVVAVIRNSAIREQLVAALDDWFHLERLKAASNMPPVVAHEQLGAIAQLSDPDPYRRRLRDKIITHPRAPLLEDAEDPALLSQPPTVITRLAGLLAQDGAEEAAVALLKRAQQRYPSDFWINHNLARLLASDPAHLEEAVGYYRAALSVRPITPGAYVNLGVTLRKLHRLDEAAAAFQRSIVLKPDYPAPYFNLGNVLRDQGKVEEAEAKYRNVLQLRPNHAETFCNLGHVLQHQGRLREALEALRRGHELGSQRAHWKYPSEQWGRNVEKLIDFQQEGGSEAIRTFPGHDDWATCVAFVSEEKILSAGVDKTLRLWDVRTAEQLKTFDGHQDKIWSLAVSADGRLALAGDQDSTVRLWDLIEEEELAFHRAGDHHHVVGAVAFFPDGRRALSTCWDGFVRIYDTERLQVVDRIRYPIVGHATYCDGRSLLAGLHSGVHTLSATEMHDDYEIALSFDWEGGAKTDQRLQSFSVSPDGQLAVSVGEEGVVRLWNLSTGKLIRPFAAFEPVWDAKFTADGKRVLFTTGGIRKPQGRGSMWFPTENHVIHLWDLETGVEVCQFPGHTHVVWDLAISPDGRHFASASFDGTIRLWELPPTVETSPAKAPDMDRRVAEGGSGDQ